MGSGKNGQQLAAENLQKFANWVADRDSAGDWIDYIRRGKLNRSNIAKECVFADSVFRQNPAVRNTLIALEGRLRSEGVLTQSEDEKCTNRPPQPNHQGLQEQDLQRRFMQAKAKADERIKALEERNAVLIAELNELRQKLNRYQFIDDHLSETGRLIAP